MRYFLNSFALLALLTAASLHAAKLVSIQPVDDRCLVIHFRDGYVEYNWDHTNSSCNGWDPYHTENWHLCSDKDQYIPYGQPLNASAAQQLASWRLVSSDDPHYDGEGRRPLKAHRKSKPWEASYDEDKPALHHWVYLELPEPLQRGKSYTLQMDPATNSDRSTRAFTFDEYALVSPAIRVSNLGYEASAPHKFADVYLWMGDGGERDFSRLTGTPWHLVDTQTGKAAHSGTLEFHMPNGPEPRYAVDLTGADVWDCDFSSFSRPGQYRLVIEGIGSSHAFPIGQNRFEEAFKTAMQGMFYQRMGCPDAPASGFPKARRPLYRQGVEPENFVVKISKRDMLTGVNPDNRAYYAEELTGEIAESTWGGWTDAYDNDQRPVNFICVFDILLAYYLAPQAFGDSQLYIPEHGNGVPDIIDEALWEIDWWLRMRDGEGGYLTGLTNIKPPDDQINYAGAPVAWQGWCVAAGSAMVADCFRLAGRKDLQERYLKEAQIAYQWADRQGDTMLDVDVSGLRGRDLKMTAAAFLYNLTGNEKYEQVVADESVVGGPNARILSLGEWDQKFASVAYLMTPQKVRHPELRDHMKASFIHQAKADYLEKMDRSPTKAVRYTSTWEGMLQTSSEMSVVAIAHKLTDDSSEKTHFEKGLYSEAEWTLGRNPLGLVQMTGLTERSLTQTFAPGRRDGHPGLTPGWTPYMCRDGWNNKDHIVFCEWYTNRSYPTDKEAWARGEQFWNTRYNVPSGETTPQQTMRQKIVLYGYLYAMNRVSL